MASARNGRGGLGLQILADPLDDLPPLDAVLLEPLGAPLLHLLGDGRKRRERLAPNAGLLPEGGPPLRQVRMGPVGGPLLHLEQATEAGVADHDLHGPPACVDHRGLHAVTDDGILAEDPAEDEGEGWRPDGDGADGVEAAGGGVEAAVEGVDVDDVGEEGRGVRIREFAPGGRRHAVPRVVVHMILCVRADHRAAPEGADLRFQAERSLGFCNKPRSLGLCGGEGVVRRKKKRSKMEDGVLHMHLKTERDGRRRKA
ncbi:unnamed protein product [Musa hybrid cultivar]